MKDQRLKNCPNCGGVLDDTGRCMYCKSKVYDLTDINIDMNSRDRLLMRVKFGDHEEIVEVYPVNMTIHHYNDYDSFRDCNGYLYHTMTGRHMKIDLELQTV